MEAGSENSMQDALEIDSVDYQNDFNETQNDDQQHAVDIPAKETVAVTNKLASYVNQKWKNSTPDIYGKTENETEFIPSTESSDAVSTEEESMTSAMSKLYKEKQQSEDVGSESVSAESDKIVSETNTTEKYETELDALTAKMEKNSEVNESVSEEVTRNADFIDEPPLPTESELDDMLAEIREIEQEEVQNAKDGETPSSDEQGSELKGVLSAIPAFSEMNKK